MSDGWDDTVGAGMRNRELMTLAQHHCTQMEFVADGGQGMAEAATGLPINPRGVRCPIAHGGMRSTNLEPIVLAFYRENCVGCEQRRPTGVVPNLASYVDESDALAAAAAAREDERRATLHRDWQERQEHRRAMMAQCDEPVVGVLRDIGSLDVDPGAESSQNDQDPALSRLKALGERAPATFTTDVVAHSVEMVEHGWASPELLDPLRILAAARPEFAPEVVRAALAVMREAASVPAGRCIADLAGHVDAADVDDRVCRSAVVLAGTPRQYPWSHRNAATDPVCLLAIADLVPDRLAAVLRGMLPGPTTPSELYLPPGVAAAPRAEVSTFLMGSAADAIRVLAATHPDLAAKLVDALVLQLASDVFGDFTEHGPHEIQRALAVMVVLDVGDVADAMTRAGAHGSELLGERLLGALALACDLIADNSYRREPGDPVPDAARAAVVADELFELAMRHLCGDWGNKAAGDAAELVKHLAKDRPQVILGRLPSLLGAVLQLLGAQKDPAASVLTAIGDEPPELTMMTAWSDRLMLDRAIRDILGAVKLVAAADPLAVAQAIIAVITDERDAERGREVAFCLLDVLGEIGAAHGGETPVLQAILPVLYTHIVGSEAGSRARAIDAWVAIGRHHQLPSTLEDLLPALVADTYVVVIQSVLRAAVALTWPPDATARLLQYAAAVVNGLRDREHANVVKEAITATFVLTSRLERDDLRLIAENNALLAAESFEPYDLRDVLEHNTWGPAASRSGQMASLRLRQAVDPRINDHFNRRDEDELVALLACGSGLRSLPAEELSAAAVAMGANMPVAAAQFVEVAWRAGRLDDAVTTIEAVLQSVPNQPAYALQKLFLELLTAAVSADAAAASGEEWITHADRAEKAAAAFDENSQADSIKYITEGVLASLKLRRVMRNAGDVDLTRPAESLLTLADEFSAVGEMLAKAGTKATATGAYLRSVAALCDVEAHLLRAEAAVLNADIEKVSAHGAAARTRCDLIAADLINRLGVDDPIGGPLLEVVQVAKHFDAGTSTVPLVEMWACVPLPVPVVVGPRRTRSEGTDGVASTRSQTESERVPVAVVLASLDGKLITGPEVLRDRRVCELSVKVQAGEWPDWADRLGWELLSHLTPAEITTPTFSWSRGDHVGDGETYEQAGSVALRFSVAAGRTAPPLLVRLTWSGEIDGKPHKQILDIAGHRELKLRPYDETRDRATDQPVFDERLLTLYDRLATAGYDDDQLRSFCRLFTAICRAGLQMTWEEKYKYRRGVRVTEREFHDDLHERLLADPELEGRLERGTALGLGYLDERHDGITAELKVERRTPVTEESAPKYMGQPTQYAAADGARLSILAILDMSPKQKPIGTAENYLFTLEPKLHGLDNPEAPSLVVVLVVNGNLPVPSSWSRKKTPIQDSDSETPRT